MTDPSQSEIPPQEQKSDTAQQLPLWQEPATQSEQDSSSISAGSNDYSQRSVESEAIADPPWQLIDIGAFLLFAVVSLALSSFIAGGFLFLVKGRWRFREALEETPFVVTMQVLWEGLWFLFIYFIVTVKYGRPFWPTIRWIGRRQSHYIYVLEGVLLAAAAQGILNLLPSQKELPIERLFTSVAASYLLAFFGICVAPFMEELVFRGFFYPVFERRVGFWRAVLITALLFAIIHGPQLNEGWAELTAIFMVGVALSYTRGKTGSLVPSYLMHVSYNTSLFVTLYLSTNRFHTLNG